MAVTKFWKQMTQPIKVSPTSKDFEEIYLVELDDPNTTLAEILAYRDCPVRFQQHPDYSSFYCINWDLDQQLTAPNIRSLHVQWSTVIPNALLVNGRPVYDDNPLRRPVKVNSDFYCRPKTMRMTFKKDATYDVKKGPPKPDVPVVTTAGEKLFLQIEEEVRAFNCVKNVAGLPSFMGKGGMFTNSDSVKFQGLSFTPRELLIRGIRLSEPRFEFGEVYYEMTFTLLVAPDEDGWCEKLRNAGFHEKAFQTTTDAAGRQTQTPYLKAITVGKPEQPQYPSREVLIDPDGIAYRAPGTGQTNATLNKLRTGPVLSTEGDLNNGIGITADQWQKAELKFWPRMSIPFKRFVPLS